MQANIKIIISPISTNIFSYPLHRFLWLFDLALVSAVQLDQQSGHKNHSSSNNSLIINIGIAIKQLSNSKATVTLPTKAMMLLIMFSVTSIFFLSLYFYYICRFL